MKKRRLKRIIFSLAGFVIVYALLLVVLVAIEGDKDGSGIDDLGDALWYSVVTITTVGYGDMYPVTDAGRIIGYVFVLASIGVLGFLIGQISAIFNTFRQIREYGLNGTDFENHVVIIGWNRFSRSVINNLLKTNTKVAVVTDSRDDVTFIHNNYPRKQVFVLFSDYQNFDLLTKVNITASAMVFINIANDSEKLVYYVNCKKHFSDRINYTIIPEKSDLVSTFKSAGVDHVLARDSIAAKVIASYVYEPDVAAYAEDLLTPAQHGTQYDIQQYLVIDGNPLLGKSFGEALYYMYDHYNSVLIGIAGIRNGTRQIFKNPGDDEISIQNGDYAIIITDGETGDHISQDFGIKEGFVYNTR